MRPSWLNWSFDPVADNTLRTLYLQTRETLRDAGIDNADFEARYFMKQVCGIDDIDLLLRDDRTVAGPEIEKLEQGLSRRLQGEPVSKICGEREFWGLLFRVTPDVLDPRPDTETLVEAALKRFKASPPATILDLGTGTGCIIVALLSEWPHAKGMGVDISSKALSVAGENARINSVSDRLTLVESNWGAKIKERYDLIVSNPPYISIQELPNLPAAVKNFDPILALDGGNDGLDCYRKIISELKSLMKKDGACFLEVGYSQAEDVARLVEDSGLSVEGVHADMTGIPRVVEISFGEK